MKNILKKIAIICVITIMLIGSLGVLFACNSNLSPELQQIENWIGARLPSETELIYFHDTLGRNPTTTRSGPTRAILKINEEPINILNHFTFYCSSIHITPTSRHRSGALQRLGPMSQNTFFQENLSWEYDFMWAEGRSPWSIGRPFSRPEITIVYFPSQQIMLFGAIGMINL